MRLPGDALVATQAGDGSAHLYEPLDEDQWQQVRDDRGAVAAAGGIAAAAAVSVAACLTTISTQVWANSWMPVLLAAAVGAPLLVALAWVARSDPRRRVRVRAEHVAGLSDMAAAGHPDARRVHELLWRHYNMLGPLAVAGGAHPAVGAQSPTDGLIEAHLLMWAARDGGLRHTDSSPA